MLLSEHVPTDVPGRAASKYDLVRYRWRLLCYSLALLRRPTLYEAVGLLLGIGGVVSALGGAIALLARLGPLGSGLTTVVIGMMLLSPFCYVFTRTPRLFSAATHSPDTMEKFRENLRSGMRNDQAYRVLERIYAPIVSAVNDSWRSLAQDRRLHFVGSLEHDRPFLAVAMPATVDESLDGLLDPRWIPRPHAWEVKASKFAPQRQKYMKCLRGLTSFGNVFGDDDGDNLVLDNVTFDPGSGHVRLQVSIATYGQIMRTSDSLLHEFALFAYIGRDRTQELTRLGGMLARLPLFRVGTALDLTPTDALRQLPWRREVHAWAAKPEDIFLHPTSRAAGLGVALTMLAGEGGEPTAYVARRSSIVGTYPEAIHVMPAGMCNTKEDYRVSGRPLRRDFLKWTMLGELLEECYNEEEFSSYRTEDWVKHVKARTIALNLPTTTPTFTGLAFDLLNLRPEVCASIKVPGHLQHDAPRFNTNWEYSSRSQPEAIAISRLVESYNRTDTVQSGVASLVLAHISIARREETERGC